MFEYLVAAAVIAAAAFAGSALGLAICWVFGWVR
jgi:hypothetical protein